MKAHERSAATVRGSGLSPRERDAATTGDSPHSGANQHVLALAEGCNAAPGWQCMVHWEATRTATPRAHAARAPRTSAGTPRWCALGAVAVRLHATWTRTGAGEIRTLRLRADPDRKALVWALSERRDGTRHDRYGESSQTRDGARARIEATLAEPPPPHQGLRARLAPAALKALAAIPDTALTHHAEATIRTAIKRALAERAPVTLWSDDGARNLIRIADEPHEPLRAQPQGAVSLACAQLCERERRPTTLAVTIEHADPGRITIARLAVHPAAPR